MSDLKDAQILIAEDQAANLLLLQRLLERSGYTHITPITRSSEVVSHFEIGSPDLLLLDLQMPAPDGFEVMKLVERWTTGETHVPILVLTADASAETKRRALDAGARDVLAKPFNMAEVSVRVDDLLQTRQHQLATQSHGR